MKLSSKLASLLLLTGLTSLAAPALGADATGIWTAAEGKSRVKISQCGNNLCGTLIWLRDPVDETGKAKLDVHNENPNQRNRSMIGVPILLSMVPEGEAFSGRIYNAEDGKTYSATLKILSTDKLQVQGCVAAVFCKTQVWTRN